VNAQAFVSPAVTADELHLPAPYPEGLGKETDQAGVGLPVDGGCGHTDAQRIAVLVNDRVPFRPGLHMDLQNEVGAFPPIAGHPPVHTAALAQPTSVSGSTRSILRSCMATMTTNGDRSRPEMGGINFRAGPSSGSLS
jgi:hypothetical protein